jgi:multidrug efflux pump subunit AcrB
VVATIVGSLLLALFIIPFVASRVLSEEKEGKENRFLKRVMGVIHHYYRPALHWCLARPKTTVVAAIGGSLLLSALLVPVIGSSLFPKADTPQFLIQVESPNGTSLNETDRALRAVEDELAKMPEVKSWFANLGHGNPQIYYNHIQRNDAANYAEVFVQLHEYDTDETPIKLQALRDRLERYAAVHDRLALSTDVGQPDVDQLFVTLRMSSAPMPKGLTADTSRLIADAMRDCPGDLSAEECAERIGLSRVSTRRYLEHFVTAGKAEVRLRYGSAGRPQRRYRWIA